MPFTSASSDIATWIVLWQIDNLIDSSGYELFKALIARIMDFLKRFALQVTPFIICFHCRTRDLRLRGHPLQLPEYNTDLHKELFIVRSLYEYI